MFFEFIIYKRIKDKVGKDRPITGSCPQAKDQGIENGVNARLRRTVGYGPEWEVTTAWLRFSYIRYNCVFFLNVYMHIIQLQQ